jgi:hypothetical protein
MKRLFLLLAVVVAAFNPLHATTVRRLSFDELVTKAQSIVVGHVVDSRTLWNNDHKLILTSYTVQVQESMKGSAQPVLTVTTLGGKVGNTVLHVSGMPVLQPGEDVILFLEQSGSHTTVVGLNQGKFTISSGEVSNTTNGLTFLDNAAGKPVKMPLDEFKRQVKLRVTR